MRVWKDVVHNVYWAIGDETLTNFLNDNWIHQVGPLRNFFVGFEQRNDTLRVCDLVDELGNWDWPRLNRFISKSIVRQIALLIPPSPDTGNDQLVWRWATRNAFSMAKTYRGMYQFPLKINSNVWKLLWKAKASSAG